MKINLSFQGYRIVLVSIIGLGLGYSGVIIYGFSAFIIPITTEFGWSRADISLAFTLCTFTMILVSPLIGFLLDRFGIRRVLLLSTVSFGTMICSMYLLSGSHTQFYITYILIAILGAGTSIISYSRLQVSWFDKYKGLALGFTLSGVGLAAIIIPPFVSWGVETVGWRQTYLILGGINLLICVPMLYFVVYNSPEEKGTYPDGIEPEKSDPVVGLVRNGYHFKQCLRMPVFWKIAAAFFFIAIGQAGPVIHLIPVLVDKGIVNAAYVAATLGVALIGARLMAGFMMDRMYAPVVGALFLGSSVAGYLLLYSDVTLVTAMIGTILMGLAIGAEWDVLAFICAQYFGRLAYGRIYAILFSFINLSAGIGLYLTGLSFDHSGTYDIALIAAAVLVSIGTLVLLTLGPYPALPVHEEHGREIKTHG